MIELNRSSNLTQAARDEVKIKIVGVGGAGSNALDRIVLDGIGEAEIVAINSDVQSLTSSVATQKVQLGRNATRGLGAGGDPEVGLAAGEEAADEIRQALEGAQMIFICTGLGGGTGSGAAPLIASIAKEHGALTIVFATMPFAFEGRRRRAQAEESLAALQEAADAVICFENDKMGDAVSPQAGVHQAFATADQTISQSVRAIYELFTRPGIIHIGFDDLVTALRNNNARCLFGYGESDGDNRANESLALALRNPLMEKGRMLADAHNILVNVTGGLGMTLNEVQILMEELGRHISDDTRVLFGTAVDPRLGQRMSVTIISSTALGEGVPVEPAAKIDYAARIKPQREVQQPVAKTEPPKTKHVHEKEKAAPVEPAALLQRDEKKEARVEEPSPAAVQPKPPTPKPPKITQQTAEPSPAPAAVAAPKTPQQESLPFETLNRGRFEKSEPTIVNGQDLDVPTFMRRNVKIK
jgi:cell division protein FtsZ